jgi:hypothetical protein
VHCIIATKFFVVPGSFDESILFTIVSLIVCLAPSEIVVREQNLPAVAQNVAVMIAILLFFGLEFGLDR